MDADQEQEDPFWPFEEDYQVPVEETEINVKDGQPKAINIRERDEEIIHICDLCGRIFIIGARSSDFQTEKVAGLDIKNRKEHFLGQPASDNAKMGYCYLCKKDLPSMGAHSDREWKGIQPPPQSLRRSCSLNLSDYVDKNDEKKAEEGYCSICDISFLTSRGLSDHRSTHKKDKNKQEVGLIIDKNDEKVAEEKRYKCIFCDMSFLTYQGLGGHSRMHSKDRTRELATNINIASSGPRTMEFDLNEPCVKEDDQGIEKIN